MSRVLCLLLALSAACIVSTTARADVVRLEDLEQRLTESRSTQADDAHVRATEADVRKAASAYYPQIALKGESAAAPGGQVVDVLSADAPHPLEVELGGLARPKASDAVFISRAVVEGGSAEVDGRVGGIGCVEMSVREVRAALEPRPG